MHTPKTAGSTITAALNPFMGPDDIQCGCWIDSLRYGGRLNRRAWRVVFPSWPRIAASTVRQSVKARQFVSGWNSERCESVITKHYNHIIGGGVNGNCGHASADQVKKYDPGMWSDSYKFAVVRNPWDHAVSYYNWCVSAGNRQSIPFKEFLKRAVHRDRPDPEGVIGGGHGAYDTGWGIYTIDDKVAVEFLVRFEHLADDLKEISARIGIPINLGIKAKGATRSKSKMLHEYYDDESDALVRRLYRNEIKRFGFEPSFLMRGQAG